MKKSAFSLLLISLAIAFTNCSNTDVIRLSNMSYPKVAPDNVQIYLSEKDIKHDYVKLALILTESSLATPSYEGMVIKAKQKAAEIGANAIISQKIDESSTLEEGLDEDIEITSEKRVKAIAIRVFKEKRG